MNTIYELNDTFQNIFCQYFASTAPIQLANVANYFIRTVVAIMEHYT